MYASDLLRRSALDLSRAPGADADDAGIAKSRTLSTHHLCVTVSPEGSLMGSSSSATGTTMRPANSGRRPGRRIRTPEPILQRVADGALQTQGKLEVEFEQRLLCERDEERAERAQGGGKVGVSPALWRTPRCPSRRWRCCAPGSSWRSIRFENFHPREVELRVSPISSDFDPNSLTFLLYRLAQIQPIEVQLGDDARPVFLQQRLHDGPDHVAQRAL